MKLTLLVFSALIVLLLTAVIPLPGGQNANVVYYSPVFMFLLAVLSVSSIWCCIKRKFSLKQIGFYLLHLGVVTILVGAFIGYLAGTKGSVQLSLISPRPTGQLLTAERKPVHFGFDVAAEDFEVKFYPPVYRLYRKLPPEEVVPGKMPYELVKENTADEQGFCVVEGVGTVSNLWNASSQEWVQRKILTDGLLLNLAGQTPKFFGVTLVFDGEKRSVSVNHPTQFKGWRFYLMSYDQNNRRYVQLSVRRDPGRRAVIIGIWLTLAGSFIFCFRKQGGSV